MVQGALTSGLLQLFRDEVTKARDRAVAERWKCGGKSERLQRSGVHFSAPLLLPPWSRPPSSRARLTAPPPNLCQSLTCLLQSSVSMVTPVGALCSSSHLTQDKPEPFRSGICRGCTVGPAASGFIPSGVPMCSLHATKLSSSPFFRHITPVPASGNSLVPVSPLNSAELIPSPPLGLCSSVTLLVTSSLITLLTIVTLLYHHPPCPPHPDWLFLALYHLT